MQGLTKTEYVQEETDHQPCPSSATYDTHGVSHIGEVATWDSSPLYPSKNIIEFSSSGERRPTYVGYIKSPADAILLLAACDLPDNVRNPNLGPPPRRISRRLLDDERASLIRSGAVFVWDEREAGMRRWTDGRCWSASRVSGCFLTYRELEVRKKNSDTSKDGPRSNLYKSEGLVKQSFSIRTSSNRKLHVISYFNKDDIKSGSLQRVSADPRITGTGIDSWNVQVDDQEYGEWINRESDFLPKHIMKSQRSREVSLPEAAVPLKRMSSDEESLATVDDRDNARTLVPLNWRAQPAAQFASDMRYARPQRMNIYSDEPLPKRFRYDIRPISPCPPQFATSRGWSPAYDLASVAYPSSSSFYESQRVVPIPSRTYFSIPSYAPNPERPLLPSLCSTARTSEAEKGTLEALASLRSNSTKVPPITALDRVDRSASGMYPASRVRGRPAPVSVTDRHTLQKLSVPM